MGPLGSISDFEEDKKNLAKFYNNLENEAPKNKNMTQEEIDTKMAEDFENSSVEKWNHEPSGYRCYVRHPGICLCGYVMLPEDHPDYKKDYDDIENIDVHGGLTYADANGYKGFDTAHAGDSVFLNMGSFASIMGHPGSLNIGNEHWIVEKVKKETNKMAAQFYNKVVSEDKKINIEKEEEEQEEEEEEDH